KKDKRNQKKAKGTYSLKGNIYISSLAMFVDSSERESQYFVIKVLWRDVPNMESFALRCRNLEEVDVWKGCLDELMAQKQMKKED
ncbi:hypothetical protein HK097_001080, partial [Rhizophlyctis rosea]